MRDAERVLAAAVASASLFCAATAGSAAGVVFEPTRKDDPVPGKCKPDDCSLREAITAANERDGLDKVVLGAGRYRIQIPETTGDDNTGGDFDVSDRIDITGKGPEKTIVDGRDVSRVITLATFAPKTVRSLTIEDGLVTGSGGGIFSGPNKATIKNVVVRSNTATESGGGIRSVSAKLNLVKSTITQNKALLGGGVHLTNGAAIPPLASIRASTISSNQGELGGGLYVDGTDESIFVVKPTAEIANSTFANNLAPVSGGGIAAIQAAVVRLDHSTVAYNKADTDNSGGGAGGGLFQSSGADFDGSDTIVAANQLGTSALGGPQCYGTYGGVLLLGGSVDDCLYTGGAVPDLMLGPLADNGGPTQTIALLEGSNAIDAENLTDCPPSDQRGETRNPEKCDFGAFERKARDP